MAGEWEGEGTAPIPSCEQTDRNGASRRRFCRAEEGEGMGEWKRRRKGRRRRRRSRRSRRSQKRWRRMKFPEAFFLFSFLFPFIYLLFCFTLFFLFFFFFFHNAVVAFPFTYGACRVNSNCHQLDSRCWCLMELYWLRYADTGSDFYIDRISFSERGVDKEELYYV